MVFGHGVLCVPLSLGDVYRQSADQFGMIVSSCEGSGVIEVVDWASDDLAEMLEEEADRVSSNRRHR